MNMIDLTPAERLRNQTAKSYIDGVHDATEGIKWCYSYRYKPKPDTIREAVIVELKSMPRTDLKRNGADLLVEILQKKYPCASSSGSQS